MAGDRAGAHAASETLAGDNGLRRVIAGVAPPAWLPRAGDGPWHIPLHDAIAGYGTAHLTVEVRADELVVTVHGRTPAKREAAVELAERLAVALDRR